MRLKHAAAIHDLSGYGRCSLTVALPVLSATGVHTSALPTAYLSAHTAFENFTFLDLSDEMEKTIKHWKELGLAFDAIYTGFLGSERQIEIVKEFFDIFQKENTLIVIDPVMGDEGKRYTTYTKALCKKMQELAGYADVITPNLTEAALLLDQEYEALVQTDPKETVKKLSNNGKRNVVLTGVSDLSDKTGACVYDRDLDETFFVYSDQIPASYFGTGDVFASVLTGALLQDKNLKDAVQKACDFVSAGVKQSMENGVEKKEGIDFEPLLYTLKEKEIQPV
jgi:pyridoxine kinase